MYNFWHPEKRRKEHKPKTKWISTKQERAKLGGNNWASARTVEKDSQRWRRCIGVLCASGHEEDMWGEVKSINIFIVLIYICLFCLRKCYLSKSLHKLFISLSYQHLFPEHILKRINIKTSFLHLLLQFFLSYYS